MRWVAGVFLVALLALVTSGFMGAVKRYSEEGRAHTGETAFVGAVVLVLSFLAVGYLVQR